MLRLRQRAAGTNRFIQPCNIPIYEVKILCKIEGMIKLGQLPLNGLPRIAVGFTDQTSLTTIRNAKKHGLDIVELRIDQYGSFDKRYVLKELKKFKGTPTIATIRSKTEGGAWNLSEAERLSLFKAVIPEVNAIDIELSSKTIIKELVQTAHRAKKLVFISYHNFEGTPEVPQLNKIANKAKTLGADVVKIATLVWKREDIRKLSLFTLSNAPKNLITIGMGPNGVISRILFPALGSLITYASLGKPTAPGQLDYHTTFELLRKLYPKFNQEKIQSLKILEAF